MIDILIKVDLVLAKLEKINEFNLHFSSSYLFFFLSVTQLSTTRSYQLLAVELN